MAATFEWNDVHTPAAGRVAARGKRGILETSGARIHAIPRSAARQPSLLVYIIRHIFARVRGAAPHTLHSALCRVLPHHALRQHRGPGQGRGRGEAAQTVRVLCDDDAMLSLPPSSQGSFRGHKHGDIDE